MKGLEIDPSQDNLAGDAWPSSVRGLSCSLQWGNERNPHRMLQVSYETAPLSGEEGEDDARSACPFDILGYTHNTIALTAGRDGVTLSQSLNSAPVQIEG